MHTAHDFQDNMKRASVSAIAATAAAVAMTGCVSIFGIVHSVDDAKVWAESHARSLSASIRARTPLPPRNRSFLIGSWRTKFTMTGRSVTKWSRGYMGPRFGGDGNNWMEMDSIYRFSDDGNYVCDCVSSSKIGSFTVKGTRSSIRGTWTYEKGTMTLRSSVPHAGVFEQRFNILWYSNDEWEMREEETSLQAAHDRLERDLKGMTGATLQSFGRICSDKGARASWSLSARYAGGAYAGHKSETITALATPPCVMKRCTDVPFVPASPKPISPVPATTAPPPPPPAKWSLVERTEIGECKTRFVFDLSDGVSVEDVERSIDSFVCGQQKAAFLQKNPDVDPGSVRATTSDFETRNGGRTLVCTVSAFTTQPTCLKHSYDALTRLGTYSARIHASGDRNAAYDFCVREIGKFVSGENVVLEVGKEPPPGAKFRLGNLDFHDGVLTIEYEAIE